MADALTFALVPAEQALTVDALLKGIEDVRKFVSAVDFAATRGNPRPWIVEQLHSSAPTIAIRPVERDPQTVEAIVRGVATITRATTVVDPPELFTDEALEDLKRMRRLFKAGIQRIEFSANGTLPENNPVTVRSDIAERVDRIVGEGYSALGSLDGELGAIKSHGGESVLTIWESLGGQPIRCRFPVSRTEEVKSLFRKRVRVIGRINYFRNGRPRSITDFRDIIDLTPDPSLPRAGFGSIPDLTDGVDSVEYVRAMRR